MRGLVRGGVSGWHGGLSFPTAATTGPAAGGYTSLTAQTAADIPASSPYPSWVQEVDGGLLVEGCSFTGHITANASNVTFLGCQFTTGSGAGSSALTLNASNYTVQYCTIGPPAGNSVQYGVYVDSGTGLTVDHCNLYGWQNAISNTSPMTITNNYIHDPTLAGGAHVDGIICLYGVAGITISGNTILNPLTQTSAIALYNESPFGTYSGTTVSGNLLGGGGYAMYCGTESGHSSTGLTVSGNWFTTAYWAQSGFFGSHTFSPTWGSSGNVWTGNAWYDGPDAGQAITG
jgi:hypothetical protein